MKQTPILMVLLAVAASIPILFTQPRANSAEPASGTNRAVLVELFTSEGCSVCPPADRLLVELDQRQPVDGVEIIALGEHVDYWDGLGWRDSFSSAEATRRQQSYSLHFGSNRVYTPQMVVDGEEEFVGSDKGQALQAIRRAAMRAKARVRIERDTAAGDSKPAAWTIHVEGLPPKAPKKLDVYVAVVERGLSSQVARGENRGRTLKHTSVVRALKKIGEFANSPGARFKQRAELPLDSAWKRDNVRIVAFAQESDVGRVLGATSVPVPPQ